MHVSAPPGAPLQRITDRARTTIAPCGGSPVRARSLGAHGALPRSVSTPAWDSSAGPFGAPPCHPRPFPPTSLTRAALPIARGRRDSAPERRTPAWKLTSSARRHRDRDSSYPRSHSRKPRSPRNGRSRGITSRPRHGTIRPRGARTARKCGSTSGACCDRRRPARRSSTSSGIGTIRTRAIGGTS